jgi:hypothetical protein
MTDADLFDACIQRWRLLQNLVNAFSYYAEAKKADGKFFSGHGECLIVDLLIR